MWVEWLDQTASRMTVKKLLSNACTRPWVEWLWKNFCRMTLPKYASRMTVPKRESNDCIKNLCWMPVPDLESNDCPNEWTITRVELYQNLRTKPRVEWLWKLWTKPLWKNSGPNRESNCIKTSEPNRESNDWVNCVSNDWTKSLWKNSGPNRESNDCEKTSVEELDQKPRVAWLLKTPFQAAS